MGTDRTLIMRRHREWSRRSTSQGDFYLPSLCVPLCKLGELCG